jgi:hypothetical protein
MPLQEVEVKDAKDEEEEEGDLPEPEAREENAQVAEPDAPPPPPPPPPSRYCPHCGGPLDEDFSFCPACGQDAKLFRRCHACGAEHYLPPGAALGHCPACGEPLANWNDLLGGEQ